MADVLADVVATYTLIDSRYVPLRAACTTPQQQTDLESQYSAAQKAWCACENKMLEDDDAEVAALSEKLKAANTKVDRSTRELAEMSAVLNDITEAVTTGAQIVAKIPA